MELPEVLKVQPLSRPVNQVCSTDILQPTTFTQTQCKFVFDKKGILDSNSKLHVAQTVVNTGIVPGVVPTDRSGINARCYLPTATGATAMVRRAYLTIGGREVSDLLEVGHFNTWKRHHYSNEYKKGVATPHQAGNDVYVGSASATLDTNNNATSKINRGFAPPYGTIGRCSSEYGIMSALSPELNNVWGKPVAALLDVSDAPKRLLTNDPTTTPGFLIELGQLCPVLVGLQLPLFAIEGEVALVIEWAPKTWGHRFMYNLTDVEDVAVDKDKLVSTIVEEEVFLITDTLYYPELMGEIHDQIMTKGGYSIPYDDVITQTNFLQYDVASGETQKDLQITLSGKRVKRIITQTQQDQEPVVATLCCGFYNSYALRKPKSYQYRIDSNNFYALPLKNSALQRQEANAIEGIPMVLNSSVFSFNNQADQATGNIVAPNDFNLTNRDCNSHVQYNDAGTQFWTGIKIENQMGQGHLMSSQPVIYSERSQATAFDPSVVDPTTLTQRVVRFFCLYQKVMNINGGLVEIIS